MPKIKKRLYTSPVRQRQAGDTRRRIVEATRHLLESEGYAGMTIEAIARRAEVSAQSVYGIFKSKTGILVELLDQAAFGADYEDSVRQAMSTTDPESRLRFAARIARQIHDAQSITFDLLRGAGVVAPELAKLEQQREDLRYKRQGIMIISPARRRKPSTGARSSDRPGYLMDANWQGCIPDAGARARVVCREIPTLGGRGPGAIPAHSRKGKSGSQLGHEIWFVARGLK